MSRRALIWRSIGVFAFGRTASTTPATQPRFRALRQPIRLPLAPLSELWRPLAFEAIGPSRTSAAGVRVNGLALRLPSRGGLAGVRAFCLTCPHEICQVDYAADPASVRLDGAPRPDHPLLVCPCHFSVFDPAAEGARIAGPATRGLYRFRLDVHQDSVAVTHVEEGALG
jgi:Rieske Fe-S protein